MTAVGRENAADKARRLLAEGRMVVRQIADYEIRADCRGDSGRCYRVTWNPADGWGCNCAARSTRCSHVRALQLCVLVNRGTS